MFLLVRQQTEIPMLQVVSCALLQMSREISKCDMQIGMKELKPQLLPVK